MTISDNDTLLNVKKLSTGYGIRQVLFDISFQVKRGEIVLLIGGNGSGKSTVLKAIYGLLNDYKNRSGSITFEGQDITGDKPFQMIKKGLAYIPQKNNTFEQLTLIENLQLVSCNILKGKEIERRIDDVFEKLPQLAPLKHRTPFHLSGGEKQQLALAMALMQKPKMILADETGSGLAPAAWRNNLKTIEELKQQEITFLIVEHRVKEIAELADSVLEMKLGRVFAVKPFYIKDSTNEIR